MTNLEDVTEGYQNILYLKIIFIRLSPCCIIFIIINSLYVNEIC